MKEVESPCVVVSGPIHRNEPTALRVIEYVDQHRIGEVETYPVPHEDFKGGIEEVRFLGTTELGGHFPGDIDSDDPEDRVAARMGMDLRKICYWLGIDIHDSPWKNSNYICVPDVVAPEQLGLAVALEVDKVAVVRNYPFFNTFPKFVSVETTKDPAANPLSQPEHWHNRLEYIAAIGLGGLRRLYELKGGSLRYYTNVAIPLVGKLALSMAQIEELEQIPHPGEAFASINLPIEIAQVLGVQDRTTVTCTWDYNNNAKIRPDFGVTRDGKPRREFFGSVFLEIDAPLAVDENTLRFAL